MISETLRAFEDIHTHVSGNPKAICSLPPKEAIEMCRSNSNQPYSIMLHPWYIDQKLIEEFVEAVKFCKDDPNFIAIGECGLDSNCETPAELQQEGFVEALKTAKKLHKPVIVHIVKAWDRLFQLVDQYGDVKNAPVVIHGYRKNVQMARQLVARGYYLSLGHKYNVDVPKMIAKDRLFHETDSINGVF